MIVGAFRDGHPRIQLQLPGPNGDLTVEFLVDTGYFGDLSLPRGLVRALGIEPVDATARRFADGDIRECAWFDFELEWNGEQRLVEVLVLDGDPLIGTQLMEGSSLFAELFDGGEVQIELPD